MISLSSLKRKRKRLRLILKNTLIKKSILFSILKSRLRASIPEAPLTSEFFFVALCFNQAILNNYIKVILNNNTVNVIIVLLLLCKSGTQITNQKTLPRFYSKTSKDQLHQYCIYQSCIKRGRAFINAEQKSSIIFRVPEYIIKKEEKERKQKNLENDPVSVFSEKL